MKYLVPYAFILPILSSCTVVHEEYYERDYYPPPAQVEVHPYNSDNHYHHDSGHNSAPEVMQHGSTHGNRNGVFVNPNTSHAPQAQAQRPVEHKPTVTPVPQTPHPSSGDQRNTNQQSNISGTTTQTLSHG